MLCVCACLCMCLCMQIGVCMRVCVHMPVPAFPCSCMPTLVQPVLSLSLRMTLCLVSLLLTRQFFISKKSALSFQGHIINRALAATLFPYLKTDTKRRQPGQKEKRTGSVVEQIINIFKWQEREIPKRSERRLENDSLRKLAGLFQGVSGKVLFEKADFIL